MTRPLKHGSKTVAKKDLEHLGVLILRLESPKLVNAQSLVRAEALRHAWALRGLLAKEDSGEDGEEALAHDLKRSVAAEHKDMLHLVAILNRVKGDPLRSRKDRQVMLYHARSLLTLLADDDSFGGMDPRVVRLEAHDSEKRKARSAALDAEVERREGDAR